MSDPPTEDRTLLDITQAAAHLGMPVKTVSTYRYRGTFPPPDQQLGRTPGWYPATLDAWQASRPRVGRPRQHPKGGA
jgi:predicted DNA-binding transcriptional regulator AlpA